MKKVIQALLICIVCVGLFGCSNGKDNTDLSSKEVQQLLEDKGFKFEKIEEGNISLTKGKIGFNSIDNTSNSELVFINTDIKSHVFANVLEPKKNTKDNEKKQYQSYQNWLEEMQLSEKQIIDVLDYYNENN